MVLVDDSNAATDGRVEEQLEFERLVAGLSIRFINLPADQVDAAIVETLGRIGQELDLDRCNFFRIAPDGRLLQPISWLRDGVGPAPAPIDAERLFPWALETFRSGRILCFATVDEIPNPIDRENYEKVGIKSALTVPLSVGGQVIGAVGFNRIRKAAPWSREAAHRLEVLGTVFANALARQQADEELRTALTEVGRLKDRLQAENTELRREVQQHVGIGLIVGRSAGIARVLEQVAQVSQTDSTVLLLGETGTGKELFASEIHRLSSRHNRVMVRVNCSAIPSTLIESELFGREKGAFTGALSRQIGRFELADQSTIFLDEIGDLPLEIQVKLLRVIEERQIERLGSPKGVRVNVRIVAATHRNLEQRVAEEAFREDLFYRLNVFPIHVPPLRERVEDVPLLVWRFVEEFSKTFGKQIESISKENLAALQRYAWPGNIRELRNLVERAMIVATGPRLTIALPTASRASSSRSLRMEDVEREHMRNVLESTGWRVRGDDGAAARLGLKPTTLETRMAKLGVARPKH